MPPGARRASQRAGPKAFGETALLFRREVYALDARLVLRPALPPHEHKPMHRHQHLQRTRQLRRQCAAHGCDVESSDLAPNGRALDRAPCGAKVSSTLVAASAVSGVGCTAVRPRGGLDRLFSSSCRARSRRMIKASCVGVPGGGVKPTCSKMARTCSSDIIPVGVRIIVWRRRGRTRVREARSRVTPITAVL